MILHRRIHKFTTGKFDQGVALAKELNHIAEKNLGVSSKLYVSSLWGGRQPRPRLVVDTQHNSLAEMEAYYADFFSLPEVKKLLPQWQDISEESWAENYTLLTD